MLRTRRVLGLALALLLLGGGLGAGVAVLRPPAPAIAESEPATEDRPEAEPVVPIPDAPEPDPWELLARPSERPAEEPEAEEPEAEAPDADAPDGEPVAAEDPETRPEPEPEAEEPPAPAFDVADLQRRLTELRYYGGAVDGTAGAATRSAVMAFQKVQGISVDGVVGPQTLAALDDPVTPTLQGGAPERLEVDLTKQVLHVVQGDAIVRTLPVSSGSGATYTTKSGGTARSLTPVGTYHVQRRIRGVREAPLGTLYDPLYFYNGWAIHGSDSVPAYPASHGCVRVTRADAVWLFDRVPVGMQIVLHGGTHTFVAGSSAPGTADPGG